MSEVEYRRIKYNLRVLKWADESLGELFLQNDTSGVDFEIYFRYLESVLKDLEKYQSISVKPHFRKLENCVSTGLYHARGWHASKIKKNTAKQMLNYLPSVIQDVKNIADGLKPKKDLTKKPLLIDIVRGIREVKNAINNELKKLNEIDTSSMYSSDWERLWRIYEPHRLKLLEKLEEIRAIDPFLSAEDEIAYLIEKLEDIEEFDERESEEKFKYFISSLPSIGGAEGRIKSEYFITEEEIEGKVRIRHEESVEVKTKAEDTRSLPQINIHPPTISKKPKPQSLPQKTEMEIIPKIPKYTKVLEELYQLAEKSLPAVLGLNRPISDLQAVLNDIERELTNYLFGTVMKADKEILDDESKDIFSNFLKLEEIIKNRRKDSTLTEEDIRMLREFSYKLKEYVRKKKSEEEI